MTLSDINTPTTIDLETKMELFDSNSDQLLNDEKLLADQIKQLEAASDQRLDPSRPFVVRVDGVSFRNYTRSFAKPFDQRMTRAFIRTSADLLQRFHPLTVFYESDEISLVFSGCPLSIENAGQNQREHMYSGRIQKLVSVLASYTASKFNFYINQEDWSDVEADHVRQRIASHSAYFDGRAFSVPNEFAAMASVFWRHRYDTLKNATLTYALSHYSPRAIMGKSPHELRELMLAEKNWDMLKEAPTNITYGTFLKKEQYEFESMDRKTQQLVITKRTRVRIGSFSMKRLLTTNEEKINFIMSKYWNDCGTLMNTVDVPDWWTATYRHHETTID